MQYRGFANLFCRKLPLPKEPLVMNSALMPAQSKKLKERKKVQPKSEVATRGKEEKKETGRGKTRS
jgi:hypothetical protein